MSARVAEAVIRRLCRRGLVDGWVVVIRGSSR